MNIVGVVLAAGFGTRLRPSTERCPKPLIPVGGVEPLFFALDKFYRFGIRRVIVNSHYLPEMIDTALANWKKSFPELQIRVSRELPEILGTGGAILKIVQEQQDWFQDSGLLLQNGDTIAQIPFEKLTMDPSRCTFAVSFDIEHLTKYKPLWVDAASSEYLGVGATPPTENSKAAHFLGVHFLSARAVRDLQKSHFKVRPVDLFSGIYRPLIEKGFKFSSWSFMSPTEVAKKREYWFDMTTPHFLLEAQRYVLDTLTSSNSWAEIIKRRYPDIVEKEPGVWVRSIYDTASVSFKAPCVFIEGGLAATKAPPRVPFTVGPHAVVIDESKAVEFGESKSHFEIQNAVLFMPRGSARRFQSSSAVSNEVNVH